MAVDHPGDEREAWAGRPRAALALRVVAWITPIVLSVLATRFAGRHLPPAHGWAQTLAWWSALTLVATTVLWATDKAARRLLPLAALLKLSLVFPDRAPSRFRSALRTGTVHHLERRIADIKANGFPDEPALAAETLIDLVAALSAHDRLTRGHAERVRAYTRMIGEELKLGEDDLDKLQWAGLLHDVGKLFVPGEILNKKGRLDDDEFEVIKTHPVRGAVLCEPLRPWLGDWVEAVGQHHERWDGRGYPEGRSGEDIALAARIVSVADVFDVITSVRSYKASASAVAAREELTRCAGSQFDAKIVRAFLGVSLGRLRLVVGPLSSIANLPGVGSLPIGPAAGALVSALATAAALVFGGMPHSGPSRVAEVAMVTAKPVAGLGRPLPPVLLAPTPTVPAPLAPVHTPPRPATTPAATPVIVWPTLLVEPSALDGPAVTFMARDDEGATPEDQSILIDVLANDAIPAGGSLVSVTANPGQGTATVFDATRIAYTPNPDATGSHLASYTIDDGMGHTTSAAIAITVTPVLDAPTALDDTATTDEDTTATINPLGNDTDPDGDTLTITNASAPYGTATTDGTTITYTPAADTSGDQTITYTVDDGTGRTATATVTVTVTAVLDAPDAADDAYLTQKDTPLAVPAPGVLGNDSDEDGDVLTVTLASGPTGGTLALNSNGSFTFVPPAGAAGTYAFTYSVSDGTAMPPTLATATVTVTDTSLQAGWYLGTAADGWQMVSTAPPSPSPDPAVEPDHDGDGFEGLTIASSDQKLTQTDPEKFRTWTLTPSTALVLNGPVILDLWSTTEGFDPSHDQDYSVWLQDCATDGTGCVTLASALNVHVDNWNGDVAGWVNRQITVGSVDHTVAVGRTLRMRLMFNHKAVWVALSGPRPSKLILTQPTVPVALDDSAATTMDTPVDITVLGNDSDPNGDPLTVTSVTSTFGTATTDGTVVSYTPATGTTGDQTITYTIGDGNGHSASATITVTVT